MGLLFFLPEAIQRREKENDKEKEHNKITLVFIFGNIFLVSAVHWKVEDSWWHHIRQVNIENRTTCTLGLLIR